MTDFTHEGKRYEVEGIGLPTVIGAADFECPGCQRTDRNEPLLRCGCGCAQPMARICQTCGTKMTATSRV